MTARQFPKSTGLVLLVLGESEESEGECLVIGRETNVTSPQVDVRAAGSQ
jgi:hypothetical protein